MTRDRTSWTPITSLRLPVALREQVRALASERGETLTQAVIEGLTLYLRKHSPSRPGRSGD